MKKKEISYGIKMVYRKLWDLLSLYEETEAFNKIFEEGKKPDELNYLIKKLDEIRGDVYTMFLGEGKIKKGLIQIVDETEYFVRRYERPGVVERWLKLNPRLQYFDVAFELVEEIPKAYEEFCENSLSAFRPDKQLIAEQKAYFKEKKQAASNSNIHISEEKMYQNELLRTLSILFEKTFQEYL